MAYAARRVTVGTSATRLDADPADRVAGSRIMVVAQASGTLVLGPAGVTAAAGCRVPVVAGTIIIDDDIERGEALYGVVASGSLDVDVLLGGA